MKKLIIMTIMLTASFAAASQADGHTSSWTGQNTEKNYISTGMPILLIAPDAVSSGMGDAGVASAPDLYSSHWNNAKYAFVEGEMGVGLKIGRAHV